MTDPTPPELRTPADEWVDFKRVGIMPKEEPEPEPVWLWALVAGLFAVVVGLVVIRIWGG